MLTKEQAAQVRTAIPTGPKKGQLVRVFVPVRPRGMYCPTVILHSLVVRHRVEEE